MDIRWRIVLPFGHLAVDSVVLTLWLWHAHALYQPKADLLLPRMQPVLFVQESAPVTFDLRFVSPPPEFELLASGTLPAMLLSNTVRPEALILTRTKLWDPVWFLIHETASFLLWFAIGVALESGFLRIKKSMMAYLAARVGFGALLTVHGVAEIGWRVEVLSWLAFGVYASVVCLRWAFSKIHAWRKTADST